MISNDDISWKDWSSSLKICVGLFVGFRDVLEAPLYHFHIRDLWKGHLPYVHYFNHLLAFSNTYPLLVFRNEKC